METVVRGLGEGVILNNPIGSYLKEIYLCERAHIYYGQTQPISFSATFNVNKM